MEKIKVVYSWIGPRGPIWNTELPNVLNLAGVAEGVKEISSLKWWGDDAWTRLFRYAQDDYEIYPAVSIANNDTRPFVIPFTLVWRIHFEHYFLGNTGILEFAHVPWHLVERVRNANGYILINHFAEAFIQDNHIAAMHGYFKDIHNIPLHKILYLTGCVNGQEIYDRYCNKNNIPNTPEHRLTIVPYASAMHVFSTEYSENNEEPEYNTDIVPEKLFLMWNRRFRQHRVEMALNLEKNNLIERSLISFSGHDIETPSIKFNHRVDQTLLNNQYGIKIDDINKFQSRLPLILDNETDINRMCEDRANASRPYYQNSLVSIVTETNFYEAEVTLTEKSFKPAKEKHPFITVGVNGALRGLQDLGFKTFSEFWDESYDTCHDPHERMRKLAAVTDQIGQWTPEQIIDFKHRVKPILEHNYHLVKNASPKFIVNKMTNIFGKNIP